MSLVAMFGFGQANRQSAADGVSPVDGIGLTDSGYAALTRVTQDSGYAAYFPVGVPNDLTQAFGYGTSSQRMPLIFRQNTGPNNTSIGGWTPATGALGSAQLVAYTATLTGYCVGFRFSWDYDGAAGTVSNQVNAICQTIWVGATTTLMSLNPQAQTLSFAGGGTMSLPPKTEVYLEFKLTTTSVTCQVNGQAFGSGLSNNGAHTAFRFGFCNGTGFRTPSTVPTAWGKYSFGDIYFVNTATGAAPFTNFLGPCKIVPLLPDTVNSVTMATSPTAGGDPLAAVQSIDGNSVASTDTSGSVALFSISQVPNNIGGKLMAIQPWVVSSKDSSYSQTYSLMEGMTGTQAPTITSGITPGTAKNAWFNKGAPSTTFPDGSALTDANLPNYIFGVKST